MAETANPRKSTAARKSTARTRTTAPAPEPDLEPEVLEGDGYPEDDYDEVDSSLRFGDDGGGAPVEDDDEDVPEEYQFTSDTGEDREVERFRIRIDGEPFYLYRPSDSLIYMLAGTLATGSDMVERLNAMMQLVQVSLDDAGVMFLRRRMADRRNNFDDNLLADLTRTILERWSPGQVDKFDAGQKAASGNRATRRQAV